MFHIAHILDTPPSLDVAIMKLEPEQTIMALCEIKKQNKIAAPHPPGPILDWIKTFCPKKTG